MRTPAPALLGSPSLVPQLVQGSVRSWDPQESELRNPSKVLVPKDCSGSGRECGERQDTAPTICWSPRCRGGADGTWDTWGHLHASPSDEVNFAPSSIARPPARLLDAKQSSLWRGKSVGDLLTLRVFGVTSI